MAEPVREYVRFIADLAEVSDLLLAIREIEGCDDAVVVVCAPDEFTFFGKESDEP